MTTNSFIKWFETFLSEKNLPFETWEIDAALVTHFIDSDIVIESIKSAHKIEQKKIKDMIVRIDYMGGNVNHFFKHLASALAHNY